jgi:hypothetical protein
LSGVWPYDECCALVTEVLRDGVVTPDEHALVLSLAARLPIGGAAPETQAVLIGGVCAVDPEIVFSDRLFCFTGESAKGPRTALEQHVANRGGRPHPRVTSDVNYLIVCDAGNPCWCFSCYGRKVEHAVLLRRKASRCSSFTISGTHCAEGTGGAARVGLDCDGVRPVTQH